MIAFLLTIAIFMFWAFLGLAIVSGFKPRVGILQGLLLSPALGMATTILLVFALNRLGMPVKVFGATLLILLLFVAVVVLLISRPVISFKRLIPVIVILVVALMLIGYPMFLYGFGWLSYGNDDMANYTLGAQRFLNHGFFDQPNLSDLASGRDYSLSYWFMHVANGHRAGVELMLAVIWAFTGLNSHQIFMPTIMALNLVLIAGAGSMVSGRGYSRRTPLVAMALLALSPLNSLGTLYQLIGQVGGMALLTAAVTLSHYTKFQKKINDTVLKSVPGALTLAGLFVWYPEALPFLVIGWTVFFALRMQSRGLGEWRLVIPALVVASLAFIALNTYIVDSILFMFSQTSAGLRPTDIDAALFPYFLVPSGLAALWGLVPFYKMTLYGEPFLSIAIAGGVALCIWTACCILPRQLKGISVPASMLLVMFIMGLLLFINNNDFGLFKLAMFTQPFLMAVVAVELGRLRPYQTSLYAKAAMPLVLLPILVTNYDYVRRSEGEEYGGLIEIPQASKLKLTQRFSELVGKMTNEEKDRAVLILDTSNVVIAKLMALYTNQVRAVFPSRSFFNNISDRGQYEKTKIMGYTFDKISPSTLIGREAIYVNHILGSGVFNNFDVPRDAEIFSVHRSPEQRVRFIHTDLGPHYYSSGRKFAAFHQLEADPMFPGQNFAALGRYLFFQLVNFDYPSRLVMELTSTVVKQHGSELPTPKVNNVRMGFVGRGSARVFSDPVSPLYADGERYLAVDMGIDGKMFPRSISGLMFLYGRDLSIDQRNITTFARDISLVSEKRYQSIRPPSHVRVFPADLSNKNLEYSGVYEDGWISERAFFVLSPDKESRLIVVRGFVPKIGAQDFSSTLTLKLDGEALSSTQVAVGRFEVRVPLRTMRSRQRIDLSFSRSQTLPSSDGRIVGAKIDFIGFSNE